MNLRAPRLLPLLALVAPAFAVLPLGSPAAAVRPDSPAPAYVVSEWSDAGSSVLPDQPYAEVHVSHFATYGITLSGQVVSAVHPHKAGSLVAPAFDRPIEEVVASESFGMALDDLGRVHTWGDAPAIPAADRDETYRDLAAGSTHAIGVTTGGELRFWGSAPWGEFGFTASDLEQEIVSVDTSSSSSVALTAEGRVISAGGAVTSEWSPDFAFPADRADERIVSIDVGAEFALALTEDGEVIAWGTNNWGERDVPAFPSGRHAVAVSAGTHMAGVVLDDGSVVTWGQPDRTVLPATVPGVPAADLDLENYRATITYPTLMPAATPAIAGTPRLGETLTADAGSWTPEPTEVHYQWHAHHPDGSSLHVGTDSASYSPSAEDAEDGVRLSVTVTARAPSLAPARLRSEPTEPVARSPFTTAPTLSLTGAPRVGTTITAVATATVPTPDDQQWAWFTVVPGEEGDERTLTPLDADGPSLPLTPDLVGARVLARLTIAKTGHETSSAETDEVVVQPGTMSGTAVDVTGTPRIGETLTAAATGTTPAADDTAYAWFVRADGGQLTAIAGATTTLALTPDLVGRTVLARTTTTRVGYADGITDSADIVVAPGVLASPAVTVAGTARVGQTLTATTTGDPQATTSYQWLRGGVPITGATSPTYVVTVADRGQALQVRVSTTRAGYDAASATSAATPPVRLAPARLAVSAAKKVTAGKKLAVRVRGLVAGETVVVRVGSTRATARASAVGVATVRVKITGKPGKRTITVVGSQPDRTGRATLRVVPPRRR